MSIDCRTCGACCAFFHEIDLDEDGNRGIPDDFIGLYGSMKVDPTTSRCAALDGKVGACVSCRVYDARPSVCRDFVQSPANCNEPRRWVGLPPLPKKTP